METSLSRESDLNAGQWKNSPGCQSKEWTEIDNFLGYGFAAAFDIAYVGCLFILEGHLHIPVGIRACWWHMEHRRCIVEAGDQLALLYQMHSIISTATFFCSYLDQLCYCTSNLYSTRNTKENAVFFLENSENSFLSVCQPF